MAKLAIFFCGVIATAASSEIELVLTGDVNLNPQLPDSRLSDPTYIWGDLLPFIKGGGSRVLAINHESTLEQALDADPKIIQFQDPVGYQHTYTAAGVNVSFMSVANNHQNDFTISGLLDSIAQMRRFDIPFGGIGLTAADVMAPKLVPVQGGNTIAFFTLVVDECWVWPNGSLYLDACTCGTNNGPTPPYQCYNANATLPGLWYTWGITDAFVAQLAQTVQTYKTANPSHLVVTFLHVGPNFQWQPYSEREQLLRNLSLAGADIVWGTSSHHIQRFEYFQGKPIIYGLGDLLFRHRPGVDDFCPEYAIPCEQFFPELSIILAFNVTFPASGAPTVSPIIKVYGSLHDAFTARLATDPANTDWLLQTFNELSMPYGANLSVTDEPGVWVIRPTDPDD